MVAAKAAPKPGFHTLNTPRPLEDITNPLRVGNVMVVEEVELEIFSMLKRLVTSRRILLIGFFAYV